MFSVAGCKGKDGEKGADGVNGKDATNGAPVLTVPSAEQTVYEGKVSSVVTEFLVVDEISASAITINSDIEVRYSSDTVNWQPFGYSSINLNSKKILIHLPPEMAGWNYIAIVRN